MRSTALPSLFRPPLAAAAHRHCDRAVALLAASRGDPAAEVERALCLAPQLVRAHCLRVGLAVCAGDDASADLLDASLRAAVALTGAATAHEQAHLAAAGAWAAHDGGRALAHYAALCERDPRDLLALLVAYSCHLALGHPEPLRDLPRRALAAWTPAMRGYADVQGLLAFGLQENGDFAGALAAAREALRHDPRNARAIHAVAHVFEMRGRHDEGLAWLARRPLPADTMPAYRAHLDWHRALFELGRGHYDAALRLFDRHLAPARPAPISVLADASNLLWRLRLAGIHAGRRWHRLAQGWARVTRRIHRPFNVLHAVAAFVGSARAWPSRQLVAALRARCSERPPDAASHVAFAASEALTAFAHRDYGRAARLLTGVPLDAQALGGSRVQRDLVRMTLRAAMRRLRGAPRTERPAAPAVLLLRADPDHPGIAPATRVARMLGIDRNRKLPCLIST